MTTRRRVTVKANDETRASSPPAKPSTVASLETVGEAVAERWHRFQRTGAVRWTLGLFAWLVFPYEKEGSYVVPVESLNENDGGVDDFDERLQKRQKEKRDLLHEEARHKFALLSTTILLSTFFDFLLLFFLCPGVEFTKVVAFSSSSTPENLQPPHDAGSAPTFRMVVMTLAITNCTTFILHHLIRSLTFSACCVFIYINGSVWLICVMWGPVSELLGALGHVPVLAFYVFGHRAGVGTLVLTLIQGVLYMLACTVGFVPTSGNTIKLGLTAQMTAIMCSYVLLGFCAALNERSRTQAVCLYREAHSRLAKATKAKARFLANVSHELRTPLHGIVAASEELSDLVNDTQTAGDNRTAVLDMCSIVVESSRHMLALINDVLDFEQLDTNQLKIERIPFDLDKEFNKIFKMLEPTARLRRISLTHHFDVARCRRLGDPLRFRQVLTNLAANALKFTPEGGNVDLCVFAGGLCDDGSNGADGANGGAYSPWAAEGRGPGSGPPGRLEPEGGSEAAATVTTVVRDTGIGIPAEHIPQVFRSFTQADVSTTRKFGGSGLGLAICKRLCQLMDGRIGCKSELDRGSTFWFTLPLPVVAEEEPSGEAAASESDRRPLAGLRTLLVEDHKVNQIIGRQMLTRVGCDDVVVAPDGEQGLRVWEEQGPFDVVLMDYHMPVMDGLAATRRIRQREQELGTAHRTPIIAISASLEPEERERGASAGMDDWLAKPFDRRTLATTILRWARRPST